jgi:hypothetical protein
LLPEDDFHYLLHLFHIIVMYVICFSTIPEIIL